MFRTNQIVHFLCSGRVGVLPYIFQMHSYQTTVYQYKRYYLMPYSL